MHPPGLNVYCISYFLPALIGRPVGMNAEGMDLSALALVEDKLLEAPEEQHQSDNDAKKEVLDHLDNFGSLKDSDFLPPGANKP